MNLLFGPLGDTMSSDVGASGFSNTYNTDLPYLELNRLS